MDSFQHQNSRSTILGTGQRGWRAWRALPRLLISRQWRWITVGVLIIAAGMIRLGGWQLDRLSERRAHNALLASRLAAPPLELTSGTINQSPEEYRRITILGAFDGANEVVLRNRAYQGTPGVDIITPLRIAGSDHHVLINRGWVPLLGYDAEALREFMVLDEVQIEGIVRKPRPARSRFGPRDQQPTEGHLKAWFRLDPSRISTQLPYPLLPFYVEQLPNPAAPRLPRPHPSIELSEGSHLSYAIQWFSFAAIGLCGYAAFVMHTERERARAEAVEGRPSRG